VRCSALPRGQIAGLLSACTDTALRLWVQVMAATGYRPGEALALRWGDVAQGAIHITGSVKASAVHGAGRIGSTKTKGSVRTIPLGTGLGAALTQERDRQETLLHALMGIPANVATLQPILGAGDCVFPVDLEQRDVPVSQGGMRSRFKRAANRAGLPGVTPHWLRHTAISAMIAGDGARPGISVVEAARLAGHHDPGVTAKVYAHAVQANLQRGIALADDLIAPEPVANVEQFRNSTGLGE
jgi:integrase